MSDESLPFPPAPPAEWNPYFVAFAWFHGRSPADQAATDEGRMHRFVTWIDGEWRVWEAETGATGPRSRHSAQFETWLLERHREAS